MKMKKSGILKFILWTARLTGVFLALLISYFIIGHLLDPEDRIQLASLKGSGIIQFICFPISTIIGYLVALFRPKAGAYRVIIGQATLLILRTDLLLTGLEFISVPAVLYLIHEWKSK
ncbi:MAG: hypothetical protein ACKOKF_00030 [Bacteroidota bacterium]